jgi:hypothetical protein
MKQIITIGNNEEWFEYVRVWDLLSVIITDNKVEIYWDNFYKELPNKK